MVIINSVLKLVWRLVELLTLGAIRLVFVCSTFLFFGLLRTGGVPADETLTLKSVRCRIRLSEYCR